MRITVRAFNKDGYHKDILLMSDRQVYQNDNRVTEPKDFPEMTHFEIVVDRHG
jgi:hypothetical protein